MPVFGSVSRGHLDGVHPALRELMEEVVKHWDCAIIDGARTIEEQRKNVAKGVSQTMESKHLPQPPGNLAHAVDVVPYPQPDWALVDKGLNAMKRADPTLQAARFYAFVGFVQGVAAMKGIPIRSGADWDSDRQFGDHPFIDLPHHELRDL